MLGEGELMQDLLANGFRRQVSLVEAKSFDTRQSALNIAKAPASGKIRTVVLVADAIHILRAVRAIKNAGLKVVPVSVYFRAAAPLNVTDLVPMVHALNSLRYALREPVGMAWYRTRRAIAG